MKAADLRKAILQAAVQGKLVSQDKNDEPASELLKRIQAEKATLIKDGKLKKEKPLSPITEDEIPYDLPDGWVWCRLGEVTLFVATGPFGSMLHKSDYVKSGIPLVNPANMQNGSIVPSERMLVDETTRERLSSYVLHEGDIVVARRGDLGRCAVVTQSEDGWICGTGSFFLRIASSMFLPFFLLFFETSLCREQLMGGSVGTTMSNLNHAILKSIYFPLPPIKLQQRIVSKVNELMALCDELEATEKELDALESHFFDYLPKSILQAAVQGKLVPQDKNDEPASELLKRIQAEKAVLIKEGKLKKEKHLPSITEDEIQYDLPDGWVWCRLSEIGEIVGGATPDSKNGEFYTAPNHGIPWITPADMKYVESGFISHGMKDITQAGYDSCSTRILPVGSIVFSSRAPIGHIAFAKNELCTNQGFKSVIPFSKKTAKWIFYALKSKIADIENRASGTTFKEVSGKFMEQEIIPLPPLAEQQRIVAKVNELMSMCDELKRVAEQPINHDNVIPFPVEPKENIEPIAMVARGKVEGMSVQAKQAIEDLFGEDE